MKTWVAALAGAALLAGPLASTPAVAQWRTQDGGAHISNGGYYGGDRNGGADRNGDRSQASGYRNQGYGPADRGEVDRSRGYGGQANRDGRYNGYANGDYRNQGYDRRRGDDNGRYANGGYRNDGYGRDRGYGYPYYIAGAALGLAAGQGYADSGYYEQPQGYAYSDGYDQGGNYPPAYADGSRTYVESYDEESYDGGYDAGPYPPPDGYGPSAPPPVYVQPPVCGCRY